MTICNMLISDEESGYMILKRAQKINPGKINKEYVDTEEINKI